MSSTFVMDSPSGFSINAFDGEKPYVYTRWGNPTIAMLEQKIAALEQGEACVAFASGMAATTALLQNALGAGDHLIASDIHYSGTSEYIRDTLPRLGVEVTRVNSSHVNNVAAAIQANTKMIWLETPANPILRLSDIAEIAEIGHQRNIAIAVDSTFATPVATCPLLLGADYVVHSLTKYFGGHGDSLGGAVIGSATKLETLRNDTLIHTGGVLSPFNAWLIARGVATLPVRMAAHQANALHVAGFLKQHPAVKQVNYPGLAEHPQHELAARQMQNFGGMISFQVEGNGHKVAERMTQELETIHYAVSIGHHRSLIYWIDTDEAIANSYELTPRQRDEYRSFAGDGVFRLSVGLENPIDLCEDLAVVLDF